GSSKRTGESPVGISPGPETDLALSGDSRGTHRILVADADAAVVQQIASALTPLGYRVEAAGDGREALGRLRNETFGLLILAIMMPRMDGIEVLLAIRKQPLERPLPIVMLVAQSASKDTNEQIRAWVLGLGAADVIVKYRMKTWEVIDRA